MTFPKLGRRYLLSRAVEDPIEATFELNEEMKEQTSALKFYFNFGFFVTLFFIFTLIPSIIYIAYNGIYVFLGRTAFTEDLAIDIAQVTVILILLLSISGTALLLLIQIKRFLSNLLPRYDSVSGLKDSGMVDAGSKQTGVMVEGKHRKNPILAMLDLAEEPSHHLSKLIKTIELCIYLLSVNITVVVIAVVLYFGTTLEMFMVSSQLELIIISIPTVLFIPAIVFIDNARRFFIYFQNRHNIIDNVKFEKIITVPDGADPLKRFIAYLKTSDPFIKRALKEQGRTFSRNIKIKDRKGKEQIFDSVIHGIPSARHPGPDLGLDSDKFSVYIKVFKKDINKEELKDMHEAAVDRCRSDGAAPLRIVALQWKVADVADDVYDYVFDSPVEWKDALYHVQIVAEDDGIYSFIPNISYEQGAGQA